MQIIMNHENDSYIYNLAYIRALLIKKSIDNLNLDYKGKQEVKKQVLEYLKVNK